jgi:RecG-like helicase
LRHEDHKVEVTPAKSKTRRVADEPTAPTETSHYAEEVLPISSATWRHRAHIRGNVTAIRNAAANSTAHVEIEVWDETGGITLQFIGRREVTGLEVGSTICAEGMVGESDGSLVILNPSYEIII